MNFLSLIIMTKMNHSNYDISCHTSYVTTMLLKFDVTFDATYLCVLKCKNNVIIFLHWVTKTIKNNMVLIFLDFHM